MEIRMVNTYLGGPEEILEALQEEAETKDKGTF